jgi:hypothetical protein
MSKEKEVTIQQVGLQLNRMFSDICAERDALAELVGEFHSCLISIMEKTNFGTSEPELFEEMVKIRRKASSIKKGAGE